jgi:UMF1 family MFS transporter
MVLHIPARFSFLFVGIWWILFAQITFRRLPSESNSTTGADKQRILYKGFTELRQVFAQIKKMPVLKQFLSGYFFYNMGVQTVMVVAVLFARNEITWADEQAKTTSLIVSILIIQFVGIAGSFIFSKLSDRYGNINALMIAVFIWIFICVFTYAAVFLPWQFYVVAFLVGFVMGGIQSLSRSTYSKLLPSTEDHASFFSFYDVMEKMGMIIGTVIFSVIGEVLKGMRPSILSLIIYFIIGFFILLTLRKKIA